MIVGGYLFQRILADGKDSRFDKIKDVPSCILGSFHCTGSVDLALPIASHCPEFYPHTVLATLPAFGITDVVDLAPYVGGLSFEVTVDRQKKKWVQEKMRKEHDEDFLTRGLWSKSRHLNYFGESTLWTGIAVTAAGVLAGDVGMAGMSLAGGLGSRLFALGMCGVSPAYVTFLLLKVSGVPVRKQV
jgi:steroid 5-alpha reductase family enzyme